MDRRQHDRIILSVAQCARPVGDPALQLGERLTGQRELDDSIDDCMPLGLLALRRPARHRVADNVAHMLYTCPEIAAKDSREAIKLITHDLAAFIAADAAHRFSALTIA